MAAAVLLRGDYITSIGLREWAHRSRSESLGIRLPPGDFRPGERPKADIGVDDFVETGIQQLRSRVDIATHEDDNLLKSRAVRVPERQAMLSRTSRHVSRIYASPSAIVARSGRGISSSDCSQGAATDQGDPACLRRARRAQADVRGPHPRCQAVAGSQDDRVRAAPREGDPRRARRRSHRANRTRGPHRPHRTLIQSIQQEPDLTP